MTLCWMIRRKQHSDGVCIGRRPHIMIPTLDTVAAYLDNGICNSTIVHLGFARAKGLLNMGTNLIHIVTGLLYSIKTFTLTRFTVTI